MSSKTMEPTKAFIPRSRARFIKETTLALFNSSLFTRFYYRFRVWYANDKFKKPSRNCESMKAVWLIHIIILHFYTVRKVKFTGWILQFDESTCKEINLTLNFKIEKNFFFFCILLVTKVKLLRGTILQFVRKMVKMFLSGRVYNVYTSNNVNSSFYHWLFDYLDRHWCHNYEKSNVEGEA